MQGEASSSSDGAALGAQTEAMMKVMEAGLAKFGAQAAEAMEKGFKKGFKG